jgi:hypothetical protein
MANTLSLSKQIAPVLNYEVLSSESDTILDIEEKIEDQKKYCNEYFPNEILLIIFQNIKELIGLKSITYVCTQWHGVAEAKALNRKFQMLLCTPGRVFGASKRGESSAFSCIAYSPHNHYLVYKTHHTEYLDFYHAATLKHQAVALGSLYELANIQIHRIYIDNDKIYAFFSNAICQFKWDGNSIPKLKQTIISPFTEKWYASSNVSEEGFIALARTTYTNLETEETHTALDIYQKDKYIQTVSIPDKIVDFGIGPDKILYYINTLINWSINTSTDQTDMAQSKSFVMSAKKTEEFRCCITILSLEEKKLLHEIPIQETAGFHYNTNSENITLSIERGCSVINIRNGTQRKFSIPWIHGCTQSYPPYFIDNWIVTLKRKSSHFDFLLQFYGTDTPDSSEPLITLPVEYADKRIPQKSIFENFVTTDYLHNYLVLPNSNNTTIMVVDPNLWPSPKVKTKSDLKPEGPLLIILPDNNGKTNSSSIPAQTVVETEKDNDPLDPSVVETHWYSCFTNCFQCLYRLWENLTHCLFS